ncbi:hypothetical protein GCM10009801_74390 [Streptomyces albiaxialis]|uniref:Lipoprotein n=1 Tax=Streptomyces albiaxialis TaxID=329523 RepID=A0ABN2WXU8_9ACTN
MTRRAPKGWGTPRSRGVPALAVAALLLTAGCADEKGPAPSDAAESSSGPRPVLPTREVRELTLPFDSYALDSPQMAHITLAQDRLIASCMADKGLKWKRLPRPEAKSWPHRGRYGLIEAEAARRYGYHPVPEPRAEARERWIARREAGLTPEQRSAAYGRDGKGGCEERAARTLLKNVPRADFEGLDRAAASLYERSKRHPDVERAFRRWSACMREKGFSYSTPSAANNDPRWQKASAKPTAKSSAKASREERTTARADVLCKHSTSLVAVWRRTEAELQRDEIDRHPERYALLHRARSHYMANVKAASGRR